MWRSERCFSAVNFLAVACLCSVLAIVCQSGNGDLRAAEAKSPYEQILESRQIPATSTGLAKYLKELHPSEEQLARARALIKQLGDPDSFQNREAAMSKLLIMPTLPSESLIDASTGSDPEVRWRAKRVLEIGKPESTKAMQAAFKVIAANRITGVMPELLAAVPLCDKRYLIQSAMDAAESSATEADAVLLRKALSHENEQVRVTATTALAAALGEDAAKDLHGKLKDKSDPVKLAAARAIANFGDRKSLPVLLAMLESENLQVRVSASAALRQLSGQHFGFAAYDKADKRQLVVAKWKDWVEGDGRTVELNFPLKKFGSGVGYLAGNTLLAYGYQNKVEELTPEGKAVWSYQSNGCWSAEKMANGNVLIAEYNGNRVIQVSPEGKIVWEYSVSNPLNAKPLDSGNVLIAQHSGNKALEVSPDKKVVWQHNTKSSCSDVHRLENGNTLIACYGANVVEITPEGKEVWSYPLTQSYGCSPLANGNVLITNFGDGRVVEVTRDKKVVWEFRENNAVDAFRLPNGNTLITGGNRFVEVTPDKKIIWTKSGCSYGTARK